MGIDPANIELTIGLLVENTDERKPTEAAETTTFIILATTAPARLRTALLLIQRVCNTCDEPTLTVTEAADKDTWCPKIVTNMLPVDATFVETVPDIDGLLYENARETLPLTPSIDTWMACLKALPADDLHLIALTENQIETSHVENPIFTLADAWFNDCPETNVTEDPVAGAFEELELLMCATTGALNDRAVVNVLDRKTWMPSEYITKIASNLRLTDESLHRKEDSEFHKLDSQTVEPTEMR
jgi:hypothetical protein